MFTSENVNKKTINRIEKMYIPTTFRKRKKKIEKKTSKSHEQLEKWRKK